MQDKGIIGILGGMGALATADLFTKIIRLTDAEKDADHIHIIIDNYTQIPDRTKAITEGNDAPVSFMQEAAKRLQLAGVDFIIMPCNTAHVFIDKVKEAVKIPFLNMIEEVAKALQRDSIKCAGILATNGVGKSGIYTQCLEKCGIKPIYPTAAGQEIIMDIIYNQVKAGKKADLQAIMPELAAMQAQGAEIFILGCTELPIAFEGVNDYRFCDCTEILAKAAITAANYKVK